MVEHANQGLQVPAGASYVYETCYQVTPKISSVAAYEHNQTRYNMVNAIESNTMTPMTVFSYAIFPRFPRGGVGGGGGGGGVNQ